MGQLDLYTGPNTSMKELSYCGRCKRCVHLCELFLPIQAEKEERKNKKLLESTNKQAALK